MTINKETNKIKITNKLILDKIELGIKKSKISIPPKSKIKSNIVPKTKQLNLENGNQVKQLIETKFKKPTESNKSKSRIVNYTNLDSMNTSNNCSKIKRRYPTNKEGIIKITKSKQNIIKIGSLNVRTLKHKENLTELEKAFQTSKLDILGLSEVRREGEHLIQTKEGNTFGYIGNNEGQRGVGFLIKNEWAKRLKEFKGITDRIAILKLEVGIDKTLNIIQVYSPTSASKNDEFENFLNTLKVHSNLLKKKQQIPNTHNGRLQLSSGTKRMERRFNNGRVQFWKKK